MLRARPVLVEAGDVGDPTLRGAQLGEQTVGIGARPESVIAAAWGSKVVHGAGNRWQRAHSNDQSGDETGVAQGQVLDDRAPQVAAGRDNVGVAEMIVDERIEVAAVGRDVMEPVGSELRCPEPRRSGAMTSKPAAPNGSRLRVQMRLVHGHPCTSRSGRPPLPLWT